MNRFVVYPNARRGWVVLREGDQLPMHFPDRDAAIRYAQCLASANRPSALTVETAFGAVAGGWVYERAGRSRPIQSTRA